MIIPVQEHAMFLHMFLCPFFYQDLIVFGLQVFASLGRFIPRYFVFGAVVNGIVSLISDISLLQKCNSFLYINFGSCNFTRFIDEF